jgi:hypothetical protein
MSPILEYSFSLNSISLLVIILFSAMAGYLSQRGQIKRKNIRIGRLEMQVLEANAEALEFQKEYCDLESRLKELKIPVISMKLSGKEEVPEEHQPVAAPLQQKRPTRMGTA